MYLSQRQRLPEQRRTIEINPWFRFLDGGFRSNYEGVHPSILCRRSEQKKMEKVKEMRMTKRKKIRMKRDYEEVMS